VAAASPGYRLPPAFYGRSGPRWRPVADDEGRAWRSARGVYGGGANVIAEAMRFLGAPNITGTRGPWCADYTSLVLRRTGHRPLANRLAASALRYGPHTGEPRVGDLVVMNTRRGYARHVGFFAGWDRDRVVIISGNWRGRVSRALISRRAVAAFIRV
jgi:uncharacterized protein (TIGR02594 family)